MRLRNLVGAAFWSGAVAVAQTTAPTPATNAPRPLFLQQCIDMALARNLELQIEHLSPEIARDNLNAAAGPYDPTLSLHAGTRTISEPGDVDPRKENPYLPYQERVDSVGPELDGRLPMGFSFELVGDTGPKSAHTDMFGTDEAADFANGVRSTNNFHASAEMRVRQHLLKDFWIDSYRETLLFRKSDLKITEEALRLVIMKTVLAVELNYYDLLAAREKIAVEEKALELKKQFLTETRRRVQVGELAPLTGQQAESQLQNTLTALSTARETLFEQQNALVGLMTDDFKAWANVELEPMGELVGIEEVPDRFRSFQSAMTHRPDLAAARLEVQKRDVAVRFERNQLFPALDFVGSYGGNGLETTSSGAISDALHLRNHEYSCGVVVTMPLGNVAARNEYRAGKASREVAGLQLKKAEQEVLLQVANYVSRVQSCFHQTISTRQARVYAESALDAAQKEWQNGLNTSYIVLEFQEALTAARNAEVDALAEYNKTIAELAFAEGTILERRHLTIRVK